jgi:hypothetical protein
MNSISTLLITLLLTTAALAEPHGLQVKNGCFVKDGHPCRGVGANYFDLFRRVLNNPTNTTTLTGLEQLSKAGIPFVRFAGPFSAQEWKLYVENKEEYLRRMDLVFRKAEAMNIGLIPSLFWTLSLSQLVDEPRSEWGNPESKTAALMREYVKDICTRYGKSPALWAYEFGNEMNLSADLPNAAQFRPNGGSERDDITAKHLVTMLSEFAKEVRKHDQMRAIISGNSHARASSWNNTASKSWTSDTQAQAKEIILRDNPAPLDTVGVHLYGDNPPEKDLGAWVTSRLHYLQWLKGVAAEAGRPVFVGEFGLAVKKDQGDARVVFEALLKEMEVARIDLAAFWVFDLPNQTGTWNVTFENDRAWMIGLTAEANCRWGQRSER